MNYNRHDEGQIADLRESLRIFGQVRSIVVQESGKDAYLIVAGHGVHQAAELESIEKLRADVIPDDWDPAQVLAYLAADNEMARRGMPDEAQLAAIVMQVHEEAGQELAKLAAGGELEHQTALLQAELLDALGDALGGDGGSTPAKRNLGDAAKQIKPALYVEDVAVFESAILHTEKLNRGDAIMDICRFYLEHHGPEG